ncbi:MAG: protein kinase [Phycisphaeraceae bacterium]|nr:protein kinase [Phycisphaeraceae bacterium]
MSGTRDTPERQRAAQEILESILDLPPAERLAAASARASGDADLLDDIQSLLVAHGSAAGFLEGPCHSELTVRPVETDGLIGRTIGSFELIERVGQGGMGAVYRARQHSPRRDVAVKIALRALTPSAVRRFRSEGAALARLQHPCVATVVSSGVDETLGLAWIALEFIDGARSITDFAQSKSLALRERLQLFQEACLAVHHAHQKGVIHRDLKPSNILVGGDGRLKVIDFGIAQLREPDTGRPVSTTATHTGIPLGTLAYMSPEQCVGEGADVRSDVFSLGVVLHELLSGQVPLELDGVTLERALRLIRDQPPPPLRRHAPDAPRDLEVIVATAMEKDPGRRYASVAAFAEDIGRFLSSRPIEARPAPWTHHLALFAARHRVVVGAAAVVVLVLLSAIWVSLQFAWKAEREAASRARAEALAIAERDEATRLAYRGTMASAEAALRAGEYRRLRERLAEAPTHLRGWEWRYLKAQSEPGLMVVHGAGRRFGVVWLSDGETLASATVDGVVELITIPRQDLDQSPPTGRTTEAPQSAPEQRAALEVGARVVAIARLPDDRIAIGSDERQLLWCPKQQETVALSSDGVSTHALDVTTDGSLLLSARESGLEARSLPGGELLWRADLGPVRCVAAHPGHERVAAVGFARGGGALIDLERGRTLALWEDRPESVFAVCWSLDGQSIVYGDGRGDLILWDGRSEVRRVPGHDRETRALRRDPARGLLVSASGDHRAATWDGDLLPQRVLAGHHELVFDVAISPDGSLLATSGWDGAIRIWPAEPASPDGVTIHDGPLRAMALSPSERTLALAAGRGPLELRDSATLELIGSLDLPSPASGVAFHPREEVAAVALADGEVLLLSTASWRVEQRLRAPQRRLAGLSFSSDGSRLAVGSAMGGLHIWRRREGPSPADEVTAYEFERSLPGHARGTWSVIPGHDAETIFSCGWDGAVARWDLREGGTRWITRAHTDAVYSLALHPDGSRLVSGGRDQRMVVLETTNGEPIRVLEGHGQWPVALAFDRLGERLFSTSWFLDIKVWDFARGEDLLTLHCDDEAALRSMVLGSGRDELFLGTGRGTLLRLSPHHVRDRRDLSPIVRPVAPRLDPPIE